MSQTMNAIEISTPGGPEVLKKISYPMPEPKEGQVLIKIAAAGVNRPDVMQRKGAYPPPPGASELPGLEVVGEIVGGGPQAGGFQIGTIVLEVSTGGSS